MNAPAARVVWLNGPYGVGKTTVAALLCMQWPVLLFDPEHLGLALGELVPGASPDELAEDLALWRSTVVHVGDELARESGAVVVMPATVHRPAEVQEMMAAFHRRGTEVVHVVLLADPAAVAARVHRSTKPETLKQRHLVDLHPVLASLADAAHHLRLDTTATSPCQVAEVVARALRRWRWL